MSPRHQRTGGRDSHFEDLAESKLPLSRKEPVHDSSRHGRRASVQLEESKVVAERPGLPDLQSEGNHRIRLLIQSQVAKGDLKLCRRMAISLASLSHPETLTRRVFRVDVVKDVVCDELHSIRDSQLDVETTQLTLTLIELFLVSL